MIFPFENNTTAIEKKLANKNLKADKNRNILIVITIVMATCLIVGTALYFFYTQHNSINDAAGRYQAIFSELDKQTVKELKSDERLQVGITYLLGMLSYDDIRVNVRTMDNSLMDLAKYPEINGKLPEAVNEVAITQAFLNKAEMNVQVGDVITLNLGNGEQQYTICGILPVEDANYSLYISDAYIKENISNPMYLAYINVCGTDGWNKEAIQAQVSGIATEYGLTQKQIDYSTYYFSLIQTRSAEYMAIIGVVSLIVALASALVIYSLFYVSIIRKINEYGKLRTIGTTAKQIKKIVLREGRYLLVIGIPCGLIIGEIAGYVLVPGGWNLTTALVVAAVAALFMYFCIMFTVRRPAQIASKITPIEAVRLTSGNDEITYKETKKLHRPLSAKRLAILNFSRNKKKTILTVCSLGICGVLLMGSSAYFNSIDPFQMARENFPYGEIKVELGSYGAQAYNSKQYYDIQKNNVLTTEFLNEIKKIDGVSGIRECKGAVLDLHIPTGDIEPIVVDGVSTEYQEMLEKYLLAGTADLQELANDRGIILTNNVQWADIFGWDIKIGEEVILELPMGEKVSVKIMGILDINNPYGGYNTLFMPVELLCDILPLENLNYQFVVDTDDSVWEMVEEEVRQQISNAESVYITSLDDWREALQDKLDGYRTPVYVFVLFIGFFGIINLLNTLMTNMMTRKREFGILQAIGLSSKQLYKVLMMAGLLYIFGVFVLSSTTGTLAGILICRVFSAMSVFGVVKYQFPVLEMIGYLLLMLCVQLIFSILTIRQLKKQSLVEQIRELV